MSLYVGLIPGVNTLYTLFCLDSDGVEKLGTFSLVPRPFLRTREEFEMMGRRKARERARVHAQKGYGNETRPLSVCSWLIFPLRPLAVSCWVVSRGGTMGVEGVF